MSQLRSILKFIYGILIIPDGMAGTLSFLSSLQQQTVENRFGTIVGAGMQYLTQTMIAIGSGLSMEYQ